MLEEFQKSEFARRDARVGLPEGEEIQWDPVPEENSAKISLWERGVRKASEGMEESFQGRQREGDELAEGVGLCGPNGGGGDRGEVLREGFMERKDN